MCFAVHTPDWLPKTKALIQVILEQNSGVVGEEGK